MIEKAPEFLDEVVNTVSGTAGTVCCIYAKDGVTLLDVRVADRMYWGTPASNWSVVRANDEMEGL